MALGTLDFGHIPYSNDDFFTSRNQPVCIWSQRCLLTFVVTCSNGERSPLFGGRNEKSGPLGCLISVIPLRIPSLRALRVHSQPHHARLLRIQIEYLEYRRNSIMETDAVGKTPAPYGQACGNCVKAKCRCMLRDGGVCDRCAIPLINTLTMEQSHSAMHVNLRKSRTPWSLHRR